MNGALDEYEGPHAPNANADPKTDGAQRDAENKRDSPGKAAVREGPRASRKERKSAQRREDQKWKSGRSLAAVNTIDKEGVGNQWDREWDSIEDAYPSDAEADRRQRCEEQTGADKNGRLSN